MARLKLYSYFRSSAAFRVRIALNLKNLSYDYLAVHLLKDGGEQYAPDFLNVNPMGEVPALVDGDFCLAQSMAILFYLDDIHPEPRLFPSDPKAKALVIQLCEMINAGQHPLQNLKVLQELERRYGVDQAGKENWVQHWVGRGAASLERLLAKTAGTYALGDLITAADCLLVPQVFSARRFKVDLSPYPIITRISDNCMKLEAFRRAEPARQPDSAPAGA